MIDVDKNRFWKSNQYDAGKWELPKPFLVAKHWSNAFANEKKANVDSYTIRVFVLLLLATPVEQMIFCVCG